LFTCVGLEYGSLKIYASFFLETLKNFYQKPNNKNNFYATSLANEYKKDLFTHQILKLSFYF